MGFYTSATPPSGAMLALICVRIVPAESRLAISNFAYLAFQLIDGLCEA